MSTLVLENLTPECHEVLTDIMYCLESAVEAFNDRNIGDHDKFIEKARRGYELFLEVHPEELTPLEYVQGAADHG